MKPDEKHAPFSSLVLLGSSKDTNALREALGQHKEVIKTESIFCLSIESKSENQKEVLLKALSERSTKEVGSLNIVFLAQQDAASSFYDNDNEDKDALIYEWLKQGILTIYTIVRNLLRERKDSFIRFWYIYPKDFNGSSLDEMISGFMRSIQQESPWFNGKVMGVDTTCQSSETLAKIIKYEQSLMQPEEVQVRYHFEKDRLQRQVNRIEALSLANNEKLSLPRETVILITGGLGGLGIIFARYFAKNFQACLILMGRSALNEKMKKQISEIEGLGGRVCYIAGDVSRFKDVEQAVTKGKQLFGKINIIIHSAGLLHDKVLMDKEQTEYETILAPKVQGTFNLDWATRNEPLVYFVCFSSVVALIGNIGQSDYAVANKFMDEFCRYREVLSRHRQRQGRSIAINWPLWEEGGMQVDEKIVLRLKTIEGIFLLTTSEGIKAFEKILQCFETQVLALAGDIGKMEQWLKREESIRQKDISNELNNDDEVYLHDELEKELHRMVIDLLKISEAHLDHQSSFQDYGFDSMTLKNFADEISLRYEINVAPSIFFVHETLTKLCKYLTTKHTSSLHQYFNRDKKLRDKSWGPTEVKVMPKKRKSHSRD